MSEPNYITPVGLERLQREIQWLQTEERPMVVREVSYAASLGDRSENAEYIYGKKRLRSIDSRIHFLTGRFDHVVVVDPAKQRGPEVRFGATVTVVDAEGEERTWRIYGEDEVDIENGVISWRSPLARALNGKREGDAIRFRAPAGDRELEIVAIHYTAQEPLSAEWRPRPPPVRG